MGGFICGFVGSTFEYCVSDISTVYSILNTFILKMGGGQGQDITHA